MREIKITEIKGIYTVPSGSGRVSLKDGSWFVFTNLSFLKKLKIEDRIEFHKKNIKASRETCEYILAHL